MRVKIRVDFSVMVWLLAFVGLGLITLSSQARIEPIANTDIRVLIDISGSMKQTDPNNLRAPALKILTGLIPAGVQAGVWQFAEDIQPLVPYGRVDTEWANQAYQAADRIGATGHYTDIGAALQMVAADFSTLSSAANVHVILLTDGMVDIADDAVANLRARRQLLQQVTTQYVQAGVQVHAIGLSHRADLETLDTLARLTDGLYTVAENASMLPDIFLTALDSSITGQQVPVQDQAFVVDSGIQSFTALMRRAQSAPDLQLQNPADEVFNADTQARGMHWQEAADYAIVTVTEPDAGHWQLASENSVLEQVRVVSGLDIMLDPLTTNLYLGEAPPLGFSLVDKQGNFPSQKHLADVVTTATLSRDQLRDDAETQYLTPSVTDVTGYYTLQLPTLSHVGLYKLTLQVSGPDWQRQITRTLRVRPPIHYLAQVRHQDGQQQYSLKVTPLYKELDLTHSKITLVVNFNDGRQHRLPVELDIDYWHLGWQQLPQANEAIFALQLVGKSLAGTEVDYAVTPLEFMTLSALQQQQEAKSLSMAVDDLPIPKEIAVRVDSVDTLTELDLNQVELSSDMAALMADKAPQQLDAADKIAAIVAQIKADHSNVATVIATSEVDTNTNTNTNTNVTMLESDANTHIDISMPLVEFETVTQGVNKMTGLGKVLALALPVLILLALLYRRKVKSRVW